MTRQGLRRWEIQVMEKAEPPQGRRAEEKSRAVVSDVGIPGLRFRPN